jgi:hypothetical protein
MIADHPKIYLMKNKCSNIDLLPIGQVSAASLSLIHPDVFEYRPVVLYFQPEGNQF